MRPTRRRPARPVLAALALAAFSVGAALGAPPPAAAQPFSLEEVLSTPYPSGLVAARHAPRIAWIENDRGVRNLFTAAAPGFAPRKLTAYTEDDGIPLSRLVLTPDGARLVYVRGGGPNRAGENPNPASNPDGAGQAIWVVPTDGSAAPVKLADGSGPVITPDGEQMLFADGGKVMEVPMAPPTAEDENGEDGGMDGGGDAGDAGAASGPQATELFQARGTLGQLAVSPDGSAIAFVTDRQTHSFVGIYDRQADRIRWIAPSVDRDAFPTWSPDGLRIAFLRSPGRRAGELLDITGGVPFAVWVADADFDQESGRGEAHQLWASPGDDGGFAQWYPDEPLRWAAGDRLLFTSEHPTADGAWMHVFSLSATPPAPGHAAAPVDLTPGPCLAEQTALSPDRTTLFISSNCGDIDRRHLWRVPVAAPGGTAEPVQMTSGNGLETDPVPLFGETVLAFRQADARRPPIVSLVSRDGGAVRSVSPELPETFPLDNLVTPEQVTFQAADGLTIHGQLFRAHGSGQASAEQPGPAVIFMHGGPIRQMLLGWHPRHYYAWAYGMNQYLASRGFTVLAVNYRSGIGYGTDFRRAPGQGPRGATEYRDIVAAGRYLRDLPFVDGERIGLWGGSYGGYLTALGLARDSSLFAAGVDLHGVHDWALRATDFLPGGAWGLTDDLLDEARASSPVADLSQWTSPVLLVQGDDDRNVLFLQTVDLVQRLRALDQPVHVETLVLPDEVHGFLRQASWLATYHRAADFFDRFLSR